MTPKLVVEFTKMHGAGNDFIVLDNRFFRFSAEELSTIARTRCTRRFSVGADGLLAMGRPGDDTRDFRLQYYNADGSVGTMCGNGARCMAVFARRAGLSQQELVFETDAGVHRAEVADDLRSARLWLPPPYPALGIDTQQVRSRGTAFAVHPVWTGTQHAVMFVEDVAVTDVASIGRLIRHDPFFGPAGTNVDFVQAVGCDGGSAQVEARTYEKGVESETQACGTGAVAAAITAVDRYYPEARTIEVRMRGGTLTVDLEVSGSAVSSIFLEGPVETVFRGTFEFA